MAKLKFKFHPLFILYVFLCVYFGWFNKIFYYVVTAVIHEFGHYIVAKHYGYEVENMIFSLYGLGVESRTAYKRSEDIIISLAGPMVNLILILLIVCLWWVFPTIYLYTYDFLICNIVVMIFNLIPIYPLDGGRVLVDLLSIKYNRKKLIKVNCIFSLILGGIFIVLFVFSLFFKINLNLLFIGIFMTLNSITHDKSSYYKQVDNYNKKYDTPVEVKVFKVKEPNEKKLVKYLSPKYYSVFECEDKGQIKKIEENDLFK